MNQAPYVIGSYVVTLGGVGLYVWHMLRLARKMAARVPEKDRPWT